MRIPLFRKANITNILKGSKKPAEVSTRVYLGGDDLLYIGQEKNRRIVVGFIDPDTGLFVSDSKDAKNQSEHVAYYLFRKKAFAFAQNAIDEELERLQELKDNDEEKYNARYKPLDLITQELSEYMNDKMRFYIDLQKQVDVVVSKPLPHINEWLLYEDDNIDQPIHGKPVIATARLPYKNPKNQTLTENQKEIVDKFLDVFFDEYNKDTFAWYMGSVLLNLPLQDERVSKVLVISSMRGGSGKSTLMEAIADNVITPPYRTIDSSFDKHFRANDRFGTSDLPTNRLGIFSEAYFNADAGKDQPHDFSGLDESELKSWITDGYVSNEKKFADKQITNLTGMQIILTNHPPQIPDNREDLRRRFLPILVKPTNMAEEKANALGMQSRNAIHEFVSANAQAFANYFVTAFNRNPNRYLLSSYDTTTVQADLTEAQQEYLEAKKVSDNELKKEDALTVLSSLGTKTRSESMPKFIEFLLKENQLSTTTDVRWVEEDHMLYINSTKKFFFAHEILPVRDALISLVGAPQKKFNQRMFALPIKK